MTQAELREKCLKIYLSLHGHLVTPWLEKEDLKKLEAFALSLTSQAREEAFQESIEIARKSQNESHELLKIVEGDKELEEIHWQCMLTAGRIEGSLIGLKTADSEEKT